MKNTLPHSLPPVTVALRGVAGEQADAIRASVLEHASRLSQYNVALAAICFELELGPTSGSERQFVAKVQIDLGGPALFTSVADADPARAVDYLFQKIQHQLRRSRATIAAGDSGRARSV